MNPEWPSCPSPEREDNVKSPSRSDGEELRAREEDLEKIFHPLPTPPPFMSNLVSFKFSIQSIHDPIRGF